MGFSVQGDYFEACTCDVSCPCIFLAPATEEVCDAFLAWHVEKGSKDDIDLAGFNVALVAHTPKQMSDGNWTVALYIDVRANEEQSEALTAIFSGAAGGHLANVAPLIGVVAGVTRTTIDFTVDGNARRVKVGDVGEVAVEQITGMDGSRPAVISNPPLGAVTQPMRQARSTGVRYADTWSFTTEGKNGFITEFSYAG